MQTAQVTAPGSFAGEPRSVDFRDYAAAVRRRWILVLVFVILGGVAGFSYVHLTSASIDATAQVVVTAATQEPLNPPSRPDLLVNMVNEQAIATSQAVLIGADRLMHNPVTVSKLQTEAAKDLSVSVPLTSDVLQFSWKAGTAKTAEAWANAFAASYLNYRHAELASDVARLEVVYRAQVTSLAKKISSLEALLKTVPAGSSQLPDIRVTIAHDENEQGVAAGFLGVLPSYNLSGGTFISSPPAHRSGLSNQATELLSALIGLIVGLIVALIWDARDDRVHDRSQLEQALEASALAVVPQAPGGARRRQMRSSGEKVPNGVIFTRAYPDSRPADAVRALRATLVALGAGDEDKAIVVANSDPAESSSRFAADLAVAFAESGRSTLLVGTDLRSSRLAETFGVGKLTGLSNALAGEGPVDAFVHHPQQVGGIPLSATLSARLAVLPNGPLLARPLSVLDSGVMSQIVEQLRSAYDVVLFDCPLLNGTEDLVPLARLGDAVIVLAGQGRTRERLLHDIRQRLDQLGARLLGGVLITKEVARLGRPSRGPEAERAGAPGVHIEDSVGPSGEGRRPLAPDRATM